MKKFLLLTLILFLFFMTNLIAKADNIVMWQPPIVNVYIEKNGAYLNLMQKAMDEWSWATRRRFLFSTGSNRGLLKSGDVKIYFVDDEDLVSVMPHVGVLRDVVTVKLKITDDKGQKLSDEMLYLKMLHFTGLIMGLSTTENKLSVMYKEPAEGQAILDEDVIKLYNMYGWKIPKNRPIIRHH